MKFNVTLPLFLLCTFFGVSEYVKGVDETFETVHLASEIASSGFKSSVKKEIPSLLDGITNDEITATCSCVDFQLLNKSNQIEITFNFDQRASSDKQSVILFRENEKHRFVWDCKVFRDIDTSKQIVRLGKPTDKLITFDVTLYDRQEPKATFCKNDVLIDDNILSSLEVSRVTTTKEANELWKTTARVKVMKREENSDCFRSDIRVYHPSLRGKLANGSREKDLPKFKSQVIPVYFKHCLLYTSPSPRD